MRKFVSKRDKERKEKRKRTVLGISLAVLMFLSVLGFAFEFGVGGGESINQNPQDKIEYNGLEFIYNNGFWTIGGFAFRYSPTEILRVNPTGEELRDIFSYEGEPLYIYSESSNARSEINVNMGPFVERIASACPEEGVECPEEILLKSCENDNFIIIKENLDRSIKQENNCVFIEGPSEDLPMMADQFLFEIFGIM